MLINLLVVINFCAYIYFGTWPTDELIDYLAPTVLDQISVDLTHVPFVGFCLKVDYTVSYILRLHFTQYLITRALLLKLISEKP